MNLEKKVFKTIFKEQAPVPLNEIGVTVFDKYCDVSFIHYLSENEYTGRNAIPKIRFIRRGLFKTLTEITESKVITTNYLTIRGVLHFSGKFGVNVYDELKGVAE